MGSDAPEEARLAYVAERQALVELRAPKGVWIAVPPTRSGTRDGQTPGWNGFTMGAPEFVDPKAYYAALDAQYVARARLAIASRRDLEPDAAEWARRAAIIAAFDGERKRRAPVEPRLDPLHPNLPVYGAFLLDVPRYLRWLAAQEAAGLVPSTFDIKAEQSAMSSAVNRVSMWVQRPVYQRWAAQELARSAAEPGRSPQEDDARLEQDYPATVYNGPKQLPDFAGRDRPYRNYRTRIRNGIQAGPNFAG